MARRSGYSEAARAAIVDGAASPDREASVTNAGS